jgi:hypothetical protein
MWPSRPDAASPPDDARGRRLGDRRPDHRVLRPGGLIKRIKRIAFGLTVFRHYRIRALLTAGRPNWDLLPTITPR